MFIKCKEYGVSLNPRKCMFSTNLGRFLGHIESKYGLTIDPERTKEILSLPLPIHKKRLQIFLGRINFVRRFIPNLATMVKALISMLKNNMVFTWEKEGRASFEEIKVAIASAPTLINPNFDKGFILYTLGGDSRILVVLTQLNHVDEEQPIASKEFLLNKDINKKRDGWITKVMEYGSDIKIIKLMRGKGLCE